MKKLFFTMLCVVFLFIAIPVNSAYAHQFEQLEFYYNGKVFEYDLESNIKTSSIFSDNYNLNKYKRFGSKDERIKLLKHMLNIGFDKQIAIEYIFPNLNSLIDKIDKTIKIEPKNAQLKTNTNNQQVFNITPEIIGIELNKIALYNKICKNYIGNKEMQFNLPIIKTTPKITSEYYKKHTNLRAEFYTDISSSSSDRKHNIKNALNSINKTELLPNEVFSFNKIVGRRTPENGYRQAKIIVNNEFIDGFGGGVCQVSSTLYNAALLAGLDVVEANKHSKQVGYVKHGFDAMVNFGSSDLKFKNNTNEKIIIISTCTTNKIRIRIYGEKLNCTYKLVNEVTNIENPQEEILYDEKQEYLDKIEYEDEFFYLKQGSIGMEIKSYREKYINNTLVNKQTLRHDKYKVQNAKKIYGTKKRTEEICA